ncbi:nucleoside diphosphate-linked moiety X motif 17-like [Anneissia japonica]|uniref:nucleoside diphosphate-linked moiety X motif 17-like n=1 Tax=Anneissia japonica TaxID=1529436 RepID=UPI0014259A66|nr:nucleoside diphosphate-linked moiety X motif 17-like [Anneissia japonica]
MLQIPTVGLEMAASMNSRRILVGYRKQGSHSVEIAPFQQCVFDYFGVSGETTKLSCSLQDGLVVLSNEGDEKVLVKHPSFCPMHALTESDVKLIPAETISRGFDVGVATLLQSSDRHLLMTRRAKHLRNFPGIWVPPGGHVEANETLQEAGLRELEEETGLRIKPEDCISIKVLALWESVYPAMLSQGLPKRHHMVIYQIAIVDEDHIKLQERLALDPNETDAAAWLSEDCLSEIAMSADNNQPMRELPCHLPQTFQSVVLRADTNQPTIQVMQTSMLFATAPPTGPDVERISTGTKFAIQQWCKANGNSFN